LLLETLERLIQLFHIRQCAIARRFDIFVDFVDVRHGSHLCDVLHRFHSDELLRGHDGHRSLLHDDLNRVRDNLDRLHNVLDRLHNGLNWLRSDLNRLRDFGLIQVPHIVRAASLAQCFA
jgi:hypothetical protein